MKKYVLIVGCSLVLAGRAPCGAAGPPTIGQNHDIYFAIRQPSGVTQPGRANDRVAAPPAFAFHADYPEDAAPVMPARPIVAVPTPVLGQEIPSAVTPDRSVMMKDLGSDRPEIDPSADCPSEPVVVPSCTR